MHKSYIQPNDLTLALISTLQKISFFCRSMYETDSFFETIVAKNYGEVNNFSVSPWLATNEFEAASRTMHYEFPQAWAFSKVF